MDSSAAAVWLVDKPAGPTSHDVVAGVRRRLPQGTKVGHAGTLDPFATGLLLVLVGRATRLARYLDGLDKTYLATVQLGARSASGDPEGPVVPTGHAVHLEELEAVLPRFLGRQRQRVPALAAVKVGGERLYRRARRGEDVELPERVVTIDELDLVVRDRESGRVTLRVRCSKGTYVRQLATDLGEALGCGAYCAELRRTAVGSLSLDRAVAPDEVGDEGGLDPRLALAHLPERGLRPDEAAAVAHGRPVRAEGDGDGAPVRLVADGRLLAVARADGSGLLRPEVVLC